MYGGALLRPREEVDSRASYFHTCPVINPTEKLTFSLSRRAPVSFLCLLWLAAILNVQAQIPPAITAPPRSQTNWTGNNIILGATVTGTPPFSYQWRFNEVPMAGQTNALLLLPMTTTNNAGSYRVVVANVSGAVTSSLEVVSINSAFGSGTVFAWGNNANGQTTVPTNLRGVTAVAANESFTMALKSDNTVVAWGLNDFGQTSVPPGLSGVAAIAAGQMHTVALKNDGSVVAWGYNIYGQTNVPAGLSGVTAIAAGGGNYTLAVQSDGTVVGWGYNAYGGASAPADLSGVAAIAAGRSHSAALKSDGTMVAWTGYNPYNEGTVPSSLGGVSAIACGWDHTVALTTIAELPIRILVDRMFVPNGTVMREGQAAVVSTAASPMP